MVTINPYLGVTKEKGYNKRKANEYNKKNMRLYHIHINKKTEKDLYIWLENHKPYQTTVKRLIREEMKREKEK